jgi:hypothetical protein
VLARRWGRSTSPWRGTLTSLLGSRTFLRLIARRRRTCHSLAPTGPPGLGSSSSAYMTLTLIFNVCMHFKRMWRRTFVCVQADYMADDADDQMSVYLLCLFGWVLFCCSGGYCSASQRETPCRGAWSPGLIGSSTHPSSRCPRSAGAALFWQLPIVGCVR